MTTSVVGSLMVTLIVLVLLARRRRAGSQLPCRGVIAACVALLLASCAGPSQHAPAASAAAFERFTALQGDWVAADGGAGVTGPLALTYRTTAAGSAVIETLWPGMPEEMVSIYYLDGDDLVLTHYCSVGNQPRLRAGRIDADRVEFAFDGGSNLDPSRDMHMHELVCEFVSSDEFRMTWQGWSDGAPDPAHRAELHFVRTPD